MQSEAESLLDKHLALIATTLVFGVSVLKIFLVAGSWSVALVMLRALGTTQILMSLVIGLMPLVPLVVVSVQYLYPHNRNYRTLLTSPVFWVSAALAVFVTPLLAWAGISVILLLDFLLGRFTSLASRKFSEEVSRILLVTILVAGGLTMLLLTPIWVSAEVVKTQGEPPKVSYVLEADSGGFATLLSESGHVTYVPSSEIETRTICTVGTGSRSPWLVPLVWIRRDAPSKCDDLLPPVSEP